MRKRFPYRYGLFLACAVALFTPTQLTGQRTVMAEPRIDVLQPLTYMLGEWTVVSFVRGEDGRFEEQPDTTFFRARTMYDGKSILSEFYGSNQDGFYGFHAITADSTSGIVHSYFNAGANRRIEFNGRFEDGSYHLERFGGYGGGDMLYRESDSNISEDSFTKRIYESNDNGETWREGNYFFKIARRPPRPRR